MSTEAYFDNVDETCDEHKHAGDFENFDEYDRVDSNSKSKKKKSWDARRKIERLMDQRRTRKMYEDDYY